MNDSLVERSKSISSNNKDILPIVIEQLPSIPRFAVTTCLGLAILGITTPILAINKPAKATTRYEVLEPETWVGKELPILEYIDIAEMLKKGTWLVLLYHYDCPDCKSTLDLLFATLLRLPASQKYFVKKFIAVSLPPHGVITFGSSCIFKHTELNISKKVIVESPLVILSNEGIVVRCWKGNKIIWTNILNEYNITVGNTGTHQNEKLTPKSKKGDYLWKS